MKLITYSLWGNNPKYTIGAIKNAESRELFYPEWECLFYINKNVDRAIINKLSKIPKTNIVMVDSEIGWVQSILRFLPFDDNEVEVFISRDCDSRLSKRESIAVGEWLKSDAKCHTMKDHPFHYSHPLLAGMSGFKNPARLKIKEEINRVPVIDYYHFDQDFLRDRVLPYYIDSIMIHDSSNFSYPRGVDRFVGQSFDENDNTSQEHLKFLR